MLFGTPVVELEDAAVGVVPHGSHGFAKTHVEHRGCLEKNENQCYDEAECLERVRPNYRLDAAFVGIKPNEEQSAENGEHERHFHGIEHILLENKTNEIEASGSSRHFRQQKKRGTRFPTDTSEAHIKITVNGRKVVLII